MDFGLDLKKSSGFSAENSGSCIVLAQSGVARNLTGTLVLTELAKVVVPGGLMGPNGALRISALWSLTNNANIKTLIIRFGGVELFGFNFTTSASCNNLISGRNRGNLSSQIYHGNLSQPFGPTPSAVLTSALDTSVDQSVTFHAALANVADMVTLESFSVEILNSL